MSGVVASTSCRASYISAFSHFPAKETYGVVLWKKITPNEIKNGLLIRFFKCSIPDSKFFAIPFYFVFILQFAIQILHSHF